MFKGFITSTESYNNGMLNGAWVEFPMNDEERYYFTDYEFNLELGCPESYFFSCYEYDELPDLCLPEHMSIDELNEIAEALEGVDGDAIAAYMESEGGTVQEAIDHVESGDVIFYPDMSLEDVAWEIFDECYAHDLPEFAVRYFDVAAFARDLGFDGYTETSTGVIYTC